MQRPELPPELRPSADRCGLCHASDAKPYTDEFGTAWVCDQCREPPTVSGVVEGAQREVQLWRDAAGVPAAPNVLGSYAEVSGFEFELGGDR
jgi:hypothetical protein